MALLRYTPSGRLDTTFGMGGKVSVHTVSSSHDFIYDLALRPDGRIVAAGQVLDGLGVVQFTAAGAIDRNFGDSGFVSYDEGRALGVALQADGRIVLAGESGPEDQGHSIVMRLDADGLPDPSFGTDGSVATSFGTNDAFRDVALQPDGNILAAGTV